MIKPRVFLATPISGFQSEQEYSAYRKRVLQLIVALSAKYDITSELQSVCDVDSYDTPEESVQKDFKEIKMSDIFLLLHPTRMQTSSLIELGYACALKKKLVIVGKKADLPYLVHGLTRSNYNAIAVYSSTLNRKTIIEIEDAIALLTESGTIS